MFKNVPESASHTPSPRLGPDEAAELVRELWGLAGTARELVSYADQNFRFDAEDGSSWVFKLANAEEHEAVLEFQGALLERLAASEPGLAPQLRTSLSGRAIERVRTRAGAEHLARLAAFLPGRLLADLEHVPLETWRSLGEVLGRIGRALEGVEHPALRRELCWDLARADWSVGKSDVFEEAERRELVEYAQLQFLGHVRPRLGALPHSAIHNDANPDNLLAAAGDDPAIVGVIDFGDAVHTARVFELAIAGAYAVMDVDDPLAVLAELCRGFDSVLPLEELELEVLFPALCMRLAVSVTLSQRQAELQPDNEYVAKTQAPAWRALERLRSFAPADVHLALSLALGREVTDKPSRTPPEEFLERRRKLLGPSLSLAYGEPLHVVAGRGTYLFDAAGRALLDGVNNVCHVGHCHPHVVSAGAAQMATLNTNTRYLHEHVLELSERLTALFPEPLSVCFFVNSGSEANELAVRLARAATGRRDMLSVEGGYHGNTSTLVDLSPYKHDGPGGAGPPEWVQRIPLPDTYRGRIRADDPEAAVKYAAHLTEELAEKSAAVIAEPLIGCGGQIVPPRGWLREVFERARAGGALCIADEVQIGFGRVGSHWWGFELDGAVPDIVTLGKPIGNGHPLGAVVTTPAIADAFANGMEYFNTFGGNPVSCAIGLAVLDVIEREGLRENAAERGAQLLRGFRELAERHAAIGDVRGEGLYLGVELVKDRVSREPDAESMAQVLEQARHTGVLLSSDGPDHNVLKLKPPLSFSREDAALTLAVVDRALAANARG